MGDDDKALDRADEAIDHWNDKQPDRDISTRDLNRSVAARQKRIDEAAATLAELRQMRPDFSAEFCDWTPFVDPRWNHALKQGLNLAQASRD